MAEYTANFNLEKQQGNEYINIDGIGANFDKIDEKLGNTARFEIARGTGTAITLAGIELADGHSKTFIASAVNNGSATTVNGKPLYKPGTTTAPKLIAGKAYTVWYDASGDCFFIKASAEGDAVAANVLAGKAFSNDDDTGIMGTMPNNGSVGTITLDTQNKEYVIPKGYHNGLGKVKAVISGLIASVIKAGTTVGDILGTFTSDATAASGDILNSKIAYVNGNKVTGNIPSKTAQTYTPGTSNQTIAAGQYLNGVQTIKGDANLIPANILSGKSIFGVAGNVVAGKRFASGVSAPGGNKSFAFANDSGSYRFNSLIVSGLNFKPNIIVAQIPVSSASIIFTTIYTKSLILPERCFLFRTENTSYTQIVERTTCLCIANALDGYVDNSGFCIPALAQSENTIYWVAYE